MNLSEMFVLMFSVLLFGMGIWAMIETRQMQRKADDIRNELYINAIVERMKYDEEMSHAEKKHKRRNSYPDMDLKREFASDQANPYI